MGFPKTGSTSIQWLLKSSLSELAQAHVDVFPSLSDALGGHHGIVEESRNRSEAVGNTKRNLVFSEEFLASAKFRQELSYVFSSEDFARLRAEELVLLQDVAPQHEIHVVACVRTQPESIARVWATAVLHSGFAGTVRDIYENSSELFDYFMILKSFESVIGKSRIHVVDFDSCVDPVKSQFDLIQDLLWAQIHVKPSPRLNISPPLGVLRIIRAFNAGDQSNSPDWDKVVSCWPPTSVAKPIEEALMVSDLSRIHKRYYLSNCNLQREFGIDLNSSMDALVPQLIKGIDLGIEASFRDILNFVDAVKSPLTDS